MQAETRYVSAYVPVEVRKGVDLVAQAEDRSRSWVVREALKRYLIREPLIVAEQPQETSAPAPAGT